eukprot:TRINITY_DN67_c0_g1_i2.p1 TRINITY_DN67_c0_g1~~TRINITY_DN67_c0_g1_i2.p1  ORF type:complete len:279 (-),score=59.54 TRINITY_DN67_c0_g1_i2:113-949(-)
MRRHARSNRCSVSTFSLPLNLDGLTEAKYGDDEIAALPHSFDARENWPHCWTIKQIRDQSACGSCWAFSSVEAMSDRLCTYGVHANVSLSAQQMNSCCDECGNGCNGGQITTPWVYWTNTGLVSNECEPYTLPSCDHHVPGPHPCPKQEYPTPQCVFNHCPTGASWKPFFGANPSYTTDGEQAIMAELVKNGPVQTAFTVFNDFPTYKSGVYQRTPGATPLGGHAVKIIGYGVEGGLPYWLVANSWNAQWGDHGLFKIRRGVDECGIEAMVTFGSPAM